MAFLRYAHATVKTPGIDPSAWDAIRRNALSPAPDFRRKTAKVLLQEYNPEKYLLTHCTIIASVDTDESPLPLGKQMVEGFEIDRRYPDFLITPETTQYVNNNNDSWERRLLLGSFKTFIGGENYCEHIQIPELSKGKIIDAAARNLGDSIYVDILVATDRKHKALIDAITSGQLGTLSMGCSCDFTICTKCGNVAEDEVHLCPCIRYFKGREFIDRDGKTRKIAELCGHHTLPNSVKFIEASWVANPAFKGAVLRNVLTPADLKSVLGEAEYETLGKRLQLAFSEAPRVAESGVVQKAAHQLSAQDQFPGASEGEAPEDKDPLTKVVDDLTRNVTDKVVEKVRGQIERGEGDKVRKVLDENHQNETLIKSALQKPEWRRVARTVVAMIGQQHASKVFLGVLLHNQGGWKAVKASKCFTGREILATSRVLDSFRKRSSIAGEARIYRTVVAVGGTAPYEDVETYLAACRRVLGRTITGSEAGALIEKGRLYALGS